MTVHFFLTFVEHILCARYNLDLKFYLNNFEMNMLDKMVPICNSRPLEVEARESGVPGTALATQQVYSFVDGNLLPDEFRLSPVLGAVIRP